MWLKRSCWHFGLGHWQSSTRSAPALTPCIGSPFRHNSCAGARPSDRLSLGQGDNEIQQTNTCNEELVELLNSLMNAASSFLSCAVISTVSSFTTVGVVTGVPRTRGATSPDLPFTARRSASLRFSSSANFRFLDSFLDSSVGAASSVM